MSTLQSQSDSSAAYTTAKLVLLARNLLPAPHQTQHHPQKMSHPIFDFCSWFSQPFFPTRIRHTPFPAPAAATVELLSIFTSELPAAASVEAVAFAFDLGFHVPSE